MSVIGTFLEAGDITNNTTRLDGVISARFSNTTVLQISNALDLGGPLAATGWSGSFTASNPVPEPATIVLLGASLLACAVCRRKRS